MLEYSHQKASKQHSDINAPEPKKKKMFENFTAFFGEVGFEILQPMINWSLKSEDSIKNIIIFYASFIFSFLGRNSMIGGQLANSAGHQIF